MSAQTTTMELTAASELAGRIRAEIRKVLIGQEEVIDLVLVALFAPGHVLVEGVPGLGKTLLVRALARSFDGTTSRIQFTPDLMPADVIGHVMYDVQSGEMRMRHVHYLAQPCAYRSDRQLGKKQRP